MPMIDLLNTYDKVQAHETSDFTFRDWHDLEHYFSENFQQIISLKIKLFSRSMSNLGHMIIQRVARTSSCHVVDFDLKLNLA